MLTGLRGYAAARMAAQHKNWDHIVYEKLIYYHAYSFRKRE